MAFGAGPGGSALLPNLLSPTVEFGFILFCGNIFHIYRLGYIGGLGEWVGGYLPCFPPFPFHGGGGGWWVDGPCMCMPPSSSSFYYFYFSFQL